MSNTQQPAAILSPDHCEAIRLIAIYTRQSFDVWRMMGPANAGIRAQVLSLLSGKKMTKSASGVISLEKACHELAGVQNRTEFAEWARMMGQGDSEGAQ